MFLAEFVWCLLSILNLINYQDISKDRSTRAERRKNSLKETRTPHDWVPKDQEQKKHDSQSEQR